MSSWSSSASPSKPTVMDSNLPSFNDIFIKAMASSSAPYPDFTANYEMSLAAIFADFPEKPKDFGDVNHILSKTAKMIFDATDSSALIDGVETYRKIADRCLDCIKGLTDNLNLSAHEIKDCWARSSRFEQEAEENSQKLQTAKHALDHQVKHIESITHACFAQDVILKEYMSKHEHDKNNYRWLTELKDLYNKLEADHKHCEQRFKAFGEMLKDNEELKKEVQDLKIENARLTVENYTHEAAADLDEKSAIQKSSERFPKAYSVNVDFPGHLSIVEGVGSSGSPEALLSMTIGLKRTDPGAAKLPGTDKQKGKWKNGMDTPSLQVSREAPGVHSTASEANSKSSADAAGVSQRMPRILKSMPLTSEEAPNTSGAISKKKLKEPKETPEDTSRKDGSSGKFIASQTPESRCVVLTNFPQGTKASDFCRIVRGGRVEQILVEVHFGKPMALIYFFHERHALAFHEWVLKSPRLHINNVPVDSKLLEVRKAASVSVAEESRVIRACLNPPTSLQTIDMTEATNGTVWADYAFDGRIDAKKFLNGIMDRRVNMQGATYGKDQCEGPFHQGVQAKNWHVGSNKPADQGATKE